jgi:transposase
MAPTPGTSRLTSEACKWLATLKRMSKRLIVPSNIPLMPLPPKCPKLNPTENIWQFIRDNWLSNRIFKSYDDIVAHCCHAWNKLIDQPWRITAIGIRDWVHRS